MSDDMREAQPSPIVEGKWPEGGPQSSTVIYLDAPPINVVVGMLCVLCEHARPGSLDTVPGLMAMVRETAQKLAAQPSAQGEAVAWKLVPVEPISYHRDDETEQGERCYVQLIARLDEKGRRVLANEVAHGARADLAADGAVILSRKDWSGVKILRAAAQPSAQGEAVAWLVEWKAHGYGPQWWGFNHTPGKNATWCSDANNAIRFARKEDAERMRLHIIAVAGLTGMHEYERSVSVTEHMWEGPCRAN